MLTAQYAQILPEIHGEGVPMVVWTKPIEQAPGLPFYLAVFQPNSPKEFANVVAIKREGTRDCKGEVVVWEQADDRTGGVQQWAEYDLLGSQGPGDGMGLLGDEMAGDIKPSSFVTLRGIWDTETKGALAVDLPPEPPASAQWMLELVSLPLMTEPEPNKSLRALHMELTRLDSLCLSLQEGTKWMQHEDGFQLHPWQQDVKSEPEILSDNDTEPKDDGCRVAGTLAKHREEFGQKVDAFIETSIKDPRGTTVLGRFGRTTPSHTTHGFPERTDLDFTDRLWNLAHSAHDSSDLSELLTAVAEGLETNKLQPFIQHTNHAPLAQVIRETLKLVQQRNLMDADQEHERLARQLDLWIDEQPSDAFVAVGVQKLRNDFWFYFVNGQLATAKQIEKILDPELEPGVLVERFWVLMRILEVWWLVQQSVPGLPRHYVCQVVSALLVHFGNALGNKAVYEEALRVTLFLPVYATEVQEFVSAVGEGIDPTRYTVLAQKAGKKKLVMLTKTPGMLGSAFNTDEMAAVEALENGGEVVFDDYTEFVANMH
ncbi:hypothetical protein FBU59_001182 [Linderina macrospora]|uniref:Uncharacterized protein n=1 Tax=Linderina macrospora TaxID=4868 RepID=A0ACC1JEX7_9FUNG|nr:hypothetical protein FBU59_001182 [Linderina macrospora]